MTIELRLTDVDPPTAEPARTIYRDIQALPDPAILGITVRYFNYDDSGLYMQITGSATGYTFTPVNLGLLASGANAYQNLDAFASRAKPTVAQLPNGEMSENITLTLKAYTDASYTTLKWTFNRSVTVIWLNSADAAFTVDMLDNFDDGLLHDWTVEWMQGTPTGGYPILAVVSDYVLSAPYSARMYGRAGVAGDWEACRIKKSVTTPAKTECYAIFDIRLTKDTWWFAKNLQVRKDAVTQIFLGRAQDNTDTDYVPVNKWIRAIIPLTPSTTFLLDLYYAGRAIGISSGGTFDLWLDDFKIISKS